MARKTVTREDLYEAARREVGLSAQECKVLVEQVFDQIASCLARGETVKLSGLGLFVVRQKRERPGRNPQTGEPVSISARRIVSFRPSVVLKDKLNTPERALSTTEQITHSSTSAPSPAPRNHNKEG
jgi:integration host factor subunit alpha